MSYIKFNKISGPHSDETSWYSIQTDAKTVKEFIDLLLDGKTNDRFITVCIRKRNDASKDVAVAYIESGELQTGNRDSKCYIVRKSDKYESYLNVSIEKIEANGGWGNTTYNIYTTDDIEEQDRDDFAMTYWGYLI